MSLAASKIESIIFCTIFAVNVNSKRLHKKVFPRKAPVIVNIEGGDKNPKAVTEENLVAIV